MSQSRTVLVASAQRHSGTDRVYHTDPECPYVKQSSGMFEKNPDNLFDHTTECKACSGEWRSPDGGWDTRRKNGLGYAESSVCLSCGAGKGSGEPCEWCERYEEVMGPHA